MKKGGRPVLPWHKLNHWEDIWSTTKKKSVTEQILHLQPHKHNHSAHHPLWYQISHWEITWPTTTWTQLQWGWLSSKWRCSCGGRCPHRTTTTPTPLPTPPHSNHHHHPTPTTTPPLLHPHPTPTPVEIIFSLSGFTARFQLGPSLG